MRRKWIALLVLLGLSSPALAAPSHQRRLVKSANLAERFDEVPDRARQIVASYGVITSTFRTIAHNREVGGVPNSYHLSGRALDVARRSGVKHSDIAAALRASGFVLIESLDEGDHSHFAFGAALTRQAARLISHTGVTIGPRVAADDHGSLLSDLRSGGVIGPKLRFHIRSK